MEYRLVKMYVRFAVERLFVMMRSGLFLLFVQRGIDRRLPQC